LYRSEQLAFVQFRTQDWPGYKDFGNYARVALFPEHLRPADPSAAGVVNFVQAIAKEVAAQQQHVSGSKHQANGQGASYKAIDISKPNQDNDQGGSPPAAAAKPLSKPRGITPAQREAIKLNGKEPCGRSPARTRTVGGLTLRDFGV